MEREVFCDVNGNILALKARKVQSPRREVWDVYNDMHIVAKLVRSQDFKGLQVWGSSIPTNLTEEQMYWIGVQLSAA